MSARGLTRELPGNPPVPLVVNADLDVVSGQFVAVIGPSGCGKSSLLYLLGLLDRPTTGTIEFEGADTTVMDGDERARLRLARFGFVFQFHFLLPEFTAIENVMLPMRRLGRLDENEARARASDLLAGLDLGAHMDKTPDKMSGGQRQRVAVARALANDPSLILSDEPTGNLDTSNSERVIEIMRSLSRDQGRAVVCVTHDTDVAAAADIRIRMRDGMIVGSD